MTAMKKLLRWKDLLAHQKVSNYPTLYFCVYYYLICHMHGDAATPSLGAAIPSENKGCSFVLTFSKTLVPWLSDGTEQ